MNTPKNKKMRPQQNQPNKGGTAEIDKLIPLDDFIPKKMKGGRQLPPLVSPKQHKAQTTQTNKIKTKNGTAKRT